MTITEHKKKNGDIVYRANIYLGVDRLTGKKARTTVTAKTKKAVKVKAREAQRQFEKNGYTTKKESTIKTYKELFNLWWGTYEPTVKPNTKQSIKGIINKHILPVFGDYRLDKLTTPVIQRQVNKWAESAHKDGTRFRRYHLLHNINKRILAYGVSLQAIDSNPARDVIVPRRKPKGKEGIKYFDRQELKTFLAYLDTLDKDNYQNLFNVTLYKLLLATGGRIGEILALEWSDIDFKSGTIQITKTLNRQGQTNSPKSTSSIRDIEIDKGTLDMLIHYKKRQQIESWQLGSSESTVFSVFTSIYPNNNKLRRYLKQHFKQAGVTDIGFHGFRHTHATLMLYNGTEPKDLQKRLGHSTIAMTLDTYVHATKEGQKKTASIFETAINNL